MTLRSHNSDKSLADQFASFFSEKIRKIRDTCTFVLSGTANDVHPASDPPNLLTLLKHLKMLLIK